MEFALALGFAYWVDGHGPPGAGGRDVASYVSTTGWETTWLAPLSWLVGAMRPLWLRSGPCGFCFWGGVSFWWCSDFETSYLVMIGG